jgi:hypothetical protein
MRLPIRLPACALCVFMGAACTDEDEAASVPIFNMDARVPDESDASRPDATTCVDSIGLEDFDLDGYARERGDCDDCDLRRGPGALDVPNNGIDEDCSGADATFEGLVSCDEPLEDDDHEVEDAVAALGLCARQVTRGSRMPGLIDARWLDLASQETLRDARQVWLPEHFGSLGAHEGSRMLVLSTGVARDKNADDYTPECDVFGSTPDAGGAGFRNGQPPPRGFPKDSSQCKERDVSAGALAYDDVGLELTLRVPGNATALAFDSMFFTYEYPDFVCSRYNDFFVALMDPADARFEDDNVVVDDAGDPIGVNTGLLSVCSPTSRAARTIACALGPDSLKDTGYGANESSCAPLPTGAKSLGGASTGWLHTEVPVQGGAVITLRFALWDSGDPLLDSTVVLDALRFIATPPTIGTRTFTAR